MKKIPVFLMTAFMVISLAACGSSKQNQPVQGVIENSKKAENTETNADNSTNAAQNTEVKANEGTNVAESTETKPDNNTNTDTTNTANSENATEESNGSNILITYFTVPETDGVDAVSSASRVVTKDGILGNTEFIAKEIQKNLGGDLFAIETTQEYPGTHDELLTFAYNEKSDNARPELSTHIDSLESYDYIFVGYPNWNADLPMPLYSFFDEYDFSGKTIIPFVTHGGSSFSDTIRTIEELEPKATVVETGLSISRDDVADAQSDVKAWTDALLKN